jgi:glycosyltransferase involved in cell wall biosynthesis
MPDRHLAPHLLYVAWGFPPSRGGGVYRALATANAFARAGWRVTVLTAEREAFERYTGSDPSLEQHVDAGIRIERLPFRWPLLDVDIREYSRLRVHAPDRWRRWETHRETASFPEIGYGRWRRPLEQAALRIHRADPVDLVVATANPNVDFAAAWALHRKHRVPYVMDYRDAWLLDVFDGDMLHADGSAAARWEHKLIHAAREVWFVNEPLRAWHARRYPSAERAMHVVSNGFDPELAPPPRTHPTRSDAPPQEGLTFGYLGTISKRVPLTELIEGWRWAREREPLIARSRTHLHGYLGFYAAPRTDLAKQLADAAADGVGYQGPVAKGDIAAVYSSFDVLLLAIGAGRYVTSGKVFEYMATGMPIVSVHDPGNAASDVLRGYPLWFPAADLSEAAVGQALIRAAHAAMSADGETLQACLRHAASYTRERQLLPRVQELSLRIGDLPVVITREPAAAVVPGQHTPDDVPPTDLAATAGHAISQQRSQERVG